jgi:tetratricopeptide (TPR) repeat protein
VLQPEAAMVLEALVWSIGDTYAPHRLILTCRYDFESNLLQDFYKQPLEGFRGADLRKKCSRLSAFDAKSQVDEALQSQARRLADGNPRLLEWLDKVLLNLDPPQPPFLRGEQNTVAEILARLEADPVELREQVLAAELLQQMDSPMREMLSRGFVFELPAPREALIAVCRDGFGDKIGGNTDNSDTKPALDHLDGYINRAVALGLLEVSPDTSLRVPRILPLKLAEDENLTEGFDVTSLYRQAAEVLYCLWWEEKESTTEEQQLEIHRLALRGKVEKIAVKIAFPLARHWRNCSRFQEAVQLCQSTLEITEDYRILHELAVSEESLGEMAKAKGDYQQALESCPPEDEKEKAAIIHNLAILKANQGQIDEAIALYQQSLAITESIGHVHTKAATLHNLGYLKANSGQIEEAIALYQQSLDITERIGNAQGKAATLHQLASLKADSGQIEEAIALYQQSLEIKERIGDAQGKAATLHELGRLKANSGQIAEAIALYQQSLDITERIGDAQGKAATLHNLAILKANTGQIEEAIALYQQSLEIFERIGNAQGKAATLHQLASLKADSGQIEEAIALYQQSLEIKERIGNAQGKAATLAMLGQLLADEKQDFDTGLNYLQQSLEILQRIQSPHAERVREIIARVQQMRDDIS